MSKNIIVTMIIITTTVTITITVTITMITTITMMTTITSITALIAADILELVTITDAGTTLVIALGIYADATNIIATGNI